MAGVKGSDRAQGDPNPDFVRVGGLRFEAPGLTEIYGVGLGSQKPSRDMEPYE